MVAKIKFVKSLKDVLSYNEKKVGEAKAELLFAAGFPRDMEALTYRNKMTLFRKLTSQNQRAKIKIVHLSLNFHPKEQLKKGILIKIAHEYMQGIGLGGQPYLVYQHFDAGHPHIHITSVNIANGGRRIEVYDKGFIKSDAVNLQIEKNYGLIRIQDHMGRKPAQGIPEQTVKLERVQYGAVETGTAIIAVVLEVVKSYKFASLADFNEILNQFGVIAYTGVPGGQMRTSGGGIVYWLLNENGKKEGVAIRPRFIEGNPTLKNLEKRFIQNKISRRPLGQRLKNLLDKSLNTTNSQKEMERFLSSHGIRAVFRKDSQGKMVGVTYMDNATRTAYNGVDLGHKYNAQIFYQAIQNKPKLKQELKPELQPDSLQVPAVHDGAAHLHGIQNIQNEPQSNHKSPAPPNKFIPAQDLPVIQVLAAKFFFDHEHESQQEQQLAQEKKQYRQKGMGLEM